MNTIKKFQDCILNTFYYLNSENFDLPNIIPYTKLECKVSFESGIADGISFTFLDQNELEESIKIIQGNNYENLDFFFVVRYHVLKSSGKRIPLRFDYYIIRFFFKEKIVELSIRHEKGTQRIPVDDLMKFLLKQIDSKLIKKKLMPIFYEKFTKITIN